MSRKFTELRDRLSPEEKASAEAQAEELRASTKPTGRTLDEILAALPEDRRRAIEAHVEELRLDIEAQWRALGVHPGEQREASRFDWSRVDSMTEAEREAAARADPDCQPWSEDELTAVARPREGVPMTVRLQVWPMGRFLPAPKTITAMLVLKRRGLRLLQAKRAIEAALLAETTITLPLVESFEHLRAELADARFSVERVEESS